MAGPQTNFWMLQKLFSLKINSRNLQTQIPNNYSFNFSSDLVQVNYSAKNQKTGDPEWKLMLQNLYGKCDQAQLSK